MSLRTGMVPVNVSTKEDGKGDRPYNKGGMNRTESELKDLPGSGGRGVFQSLPRGSREPV